MDQVKKTSTRATPMKPSKFARWSRDRDPLGLYGTVVASVKPNQPFLCWMISLSIVDVSMDLELDIVEVSNTCSRVSKRNVAKHRGHLTKRFLVADPEDLFGEDGARVYRLCIKTRHASEHPGRFGHHRAASAEEQPTLLAIPTVEDGNILRDSTSTHSTAQRLSQSQLAA
ncbi:hypothetical protein EI94DRAFT_1788223 [Lactarius quietus]|nr:hypothetical protein EI94DRAFT_1788223 [Lactarius quietus]